MALRVHIQSILIKQSNQARIEYRTRLIASVDCLRFLVRQGLAFCGHNESEESKNRGNFLELLHFLANHNEVINDVVLKNAPNNLKLISPDIQYDIINASTSETTKAIIDDLRDGFFFILVDESRDMSNKEQMAVVLRYVNKKFLLSVSIYQFQKQSTFCFYQNFCPLQFVHKSCSFAFFLHLTPNSRPFDLLNR